MKIVTPCRLRNRKLFTVDGCLVQQCPFLVLRTNAYNPICVHCHEGECKQMHAVGLDIEGNPLPEEQRPECRAKTKAGGPCTKHVIPGKRRCANHGGLSTGPKTQSGRDRIRAAQKRRWAKGKGKETDTD
ncbi:HGGxSTG domain-containing protein [Hoeflea sp. TYP-13]|uniref:HGGxSTG domain-containing protein n=1 Tax=Hoeflea sp. TYP-13 TaxID=3230023 RepID=UPI0034C6A876